MFYVLLILSLILFIDSFYLIYRFKIWFYDSKIDDEIYQTLIYFNLAVAVASAFSAGCCVFMLI